MKAVLFDLFETLITERENGINIRDFGTPDCHCPADQLGIHKALFEEEWVVRRPDRMNGVFPDYYTVLKDICLNLHLCVDDAILRSLDEKRVLAKRTTYEHIEERVLVAVRELKNKGLKIGLISNCSPEEIDGLFTCQLTDLIDEMVLSFQVGVSKPHKEIYEIACERLQVIPAECIFVGDGGASELVGATNAGIKAFRATWFYNRTDIGEAFLQVQNPMHILNII